MTVTGLNAGTTYYFALRAVDDEMNWSGMALASATTLTAADGTAPAAISDLVASHPSSGTVRLTWTAPGDDGSSGTATTYDIRYSTGTITEDNWASARQASDELAPTVAGTSQTWTVQGLSANTTYTFAIKAIDEAGNCVRAVQRGQRHDADDQRPEQAGADRAGLRVPRGVQTADERQWPDNRLLHGRHRHSPRQRQPANPGGGRACRTDSAIYECNFPGWGSSSSTWPQATLIHDWGTALYGSPPSRRLVTTSQVCYYDAATDRFYFSWGTGYNVAATTTPPWAGRS